MLLPVVLTTCTAAILIVETKVAVYRPAGFGQPQPLAPAAASQLGSAANQMTAEQQQRMAAASGWHPSLVQKRYMQLALSGLLVT